MKHSILLFIVLLQLSMRNDAAAFIGNNRPSSCGTKSKPTRLPPPRHHPLPTTTTRKTRLLLASSSATPLDPSVVSKATEPLLWETLREKEARPVLNLSSKRALHSVSGGGELLSTVSDENTVNNTCTWVDGEQWRCTWRGLQELIDFGSSSAANSSHDLLLLGCPQLARLDTEKVLASASFLVETFDGNFSSSIDNSGERMTTPATRLIQRQPKLLAYPTEILDDGLDFLKTMMALKTRDNLVKTLLLQQNQDKNTGYTSSGSAAAKLLLWGIESGLQTRAVQTALGAANEATSRANKRMAADTASALDALKKKKKGLL